jgi:Ca-activated chloride channel family protein
VAYASDSQLVIPLGQVSRERLPGLDAEIDYIAATTGTNMSGGMDLGIESLLSQRAPGRAARIIVISDGQANEGDATPEGLAGRARRAAEHSVVVTSVGVGEGFDERVMGLIADAGTGNFYFLDRNRDLAAIFAREFDAARGTVASALQVEIKPAAGVRVIDAAGYPLESRTGSVVFSPGALFEGQERRIWVTLSVPESAGEQSLGIVGLHWEHDGRRESLELPDSFRVAWADAPAEVAASIALAAWERAVGNDAYGRLEDRVADAVRNRDRAGAEREIEEFKLKVGAVNRLVQSPAVAEKLQEADQLRSDVGAAFSGDNQAQKQNLLSKSKAESGKDSRRLGAKAQAVK